MGSGSGPGRLNSRVYTNSFSGKSSAMVFPFQSTQIGPSFAGISRPQYSYITYNTLAYHGAGAGGRAGRWANASGNQIAFIPPSLIR